MAARFVVVLAALAVPAAAQAGPCAEAKVTFRFEGLGDSDARAFEAQFRSALSRACAWWGETFAGPYEVTVEDSRGPSMALVPAWRGQRGHMLFRSNTVRQGHAAALHEIVHVLAPNANRFLAESLAVYAHEHLKGVSAFPSLGKDLHEAAAERAADADIAGLDRLATPGRLQGPGGMDEQDAYIVGGSFVRFLIERDGLDRFRKLYALTPLVVHGRDPGDPARWRAVYGVELPALVAAWRKTLAGR